MAQHRGKPVSLKSNSVVPGQVKDGDPWSFNQF
jgi:hypothetical protein